jgi:alpha-tubulin suppressor-like RCC1 family protein
MGLMVRLGALLLALGACDRLLNLQPVVGRDAPIVLAQGQTSLGGGDGHTCWISPAGALYCWGENTAGQLGLMLDTVENTAIARVGDATWTAVSAGFYHTCGIQADSTLWCWGEDFEGELGDGQTKAISTAPVEVPGTWAAVSAGQVHTCAIATDGTLACWGENDYGELGDGSTTSQSTPVVLGGSWQKACTGIRHSCGLANDGSISCWGFNVNGQVGDGTVVDRGAPVAITSTERFVDLACGGYHTCAQTTTGHMRCWGANNWGQLGIGSVDEKEVPAAVFVDGTDKGDWAGVVASNFHTCAWDRSGVVYCWGDSSRGELGQDGESTNVSPTIMPGGPWTAAATGVHHVCLLDSAGQPWCVGANGWGQLGTRADSGIPTPKQVGTATDWVSVVAGTADTCALDGSGHATCGGDNTDGQLGLNDLTSRRTPAPLDTRYAWQSLALGTFHTCGASGFQVYCWGDNSRGEAGVGSGPGYLTTPMALGFPSSVDYQFDDVTASEHSCTIGINPNNQLSCWGPNDSGQIGNGTDSSMMPVYTPSLSVMRPGDPVSAWSHVVAGPYFTCGLESGTPAKAWCWGYNANGELGDNKAELQADSPIAVAAGSTTFSAIVAGRYHVCAIDGQLGAGWCWGYNGNGQLGVQDYTEHDTPMQVAGGHAWDQLAAGGHHTCGLEAGKLYCWGDNRRGQLGNGDMARNATNVPTRIGGNSDWTYVAAGEWHTCGIRAGQLYCWGGNDDGALLDGNAWTIVPSAVPVP